MSPSSSLERDSDAVQQLSPHNNFARVGSPPMYQPVPALGGSYYRGNLSEIGQMPMSAETAAKEAPFATQPVNNPAEVTVAADICLGQWRAVHNPPQFRISQPEISAAENCSVALRYA